jgi:valyl-tRNA synthetase
MPSQQLTSSRRHGDRSKKMVWMCLSIGSARALRSSTFVSPSRAFLSKSPKKLWERNILARPMSTTSETETTSYDLLNKAKGLDKYDPSEFESEIYSWWETAGCFQPDAKHKPGIKDKQPYVLPMPPPNVTGRLHMGHAIFVALQDVLARFHRMRGRPVLWLPGTDHAGIATQLQVEKQLIAEGKTREEVGREEFLKLVWAYKEEQGGHITRQMRSLGASADWTRERFTMDTDLSDAVVEAFMRLHEKGLVYRGEYMVNWAPLLKTAVSDLEVEYTEEMGKLYYFNYMVDGSDGMYRIGCSSSVCLNCNVLLCLNYSRSDSPFWR